MNANIIITDIAALFDIDSAAIFSRRRDRHISDARAVSCYVLHRKMCMSSTEVGRILNINHATVLHAVKNCESWLDDSRVNPIGNINIAKICEKYGL